MNVKLKCKLSLKDTSYFSAGRSLGSVSCGYWILIASFPQLLSQSNIAEPSDDFRTPSTHVVSLDKVSNAVLLPNREEDLSGWAYCNNTWIRKE